MPLPTPATPLPGPAGRPPRYRTIFDDLTADERMLLAQIKRFFECFEGDADLREALTSGAATPAQLAWLRDVGITFDVQQLSPLWRERALFEQAINNPEDPALRARAEDLLTSNPVLALWTRIRTRQADIHIQQRQWVTTTATASPLFSAWRTRRIAATRSELGVYGHTIDHPVIAVELAVGCTVGCYFCAFDAQKLQTVFEYNAPDNQALFTGIAESFRASLGWAAGHAMLYWRTEPHDNPDYLKFMGEWERVTGATLCTATARADEAWVRDLLAFYGREGRGPLPWPRISVLSRGIMRRLHSTFTPEETLHMPLLMQQTDGRRAKVPGGREKMLQRLDDYADLRELDVERRPEGHDVPQGSIACVSGFLVNMVDRTLKLISPCFTSRSHPHGYRIFDEVTFTDAEDFDRQLQDMITRKMVVKPFEGMPVRFRDDLRYRARPDGFTLTSPNVVHTCRGNPMYGPLGRMIAAGDATCGEIVQALTNQHGLNWAIVNAALAGLFERGLLDEVGIVAPIATEGNARHVGVA